MICFVRVVIHDHLYEVLHPAMEVVHFTQKFTDGVDGKRHHALAGTYVSEHYTSSQLAFLHATATALQVDPAAQIMLNDGKQIFSHGCRLDDSLASLLAEWAKLNPPALSAFASIPVGFGEGVASAMRQEKGGPLGSMLMPTSTPAPLTVAEILRRLT
jgi:hypothetical protein